jgi:pimeloyl-ACP methyl ester carboxylesterase
MGHSAGGQLALCLAAHTNSELAVISLAGIVDLKRAWELHLSNDAVVEFLGGTPQQFPGRFREADPMQLKIRRIQQWLVHGTQDEIIPPEFSAEYVRVKAKEGEDVHLLRIEGASHFDVIDPTTAAWPHIERLVRRLLH